MGASATAATVRTISKVSEVSVMFKVMAGRGPRANVSINGICISFPLWGFIITIGDPAESLGNRPPRPVGSRPP